MPPIRQLESDEHIFLIGPMLQSLVMLLSHMSWEELCLLMTFASPMMNLCISYFRSVAGHASLLMSVLCILLTERINCRQQFGKE